VASRLVVFDAGHSLSASARGRAWPVLESGESGLTDRAWLTLTA